MEYISLDGSSAKDDRTIRKLAREVERISQKLAVLEQARSPDDGLTHEVSQGPLAAVSHDEVLDIINARRARGKFFPAQLFADPAWDILLVLFEAEIAQYRISVGDVTCAADLPGSTTLRWLKSLTREGLIARRADRHDARRIFVELTTAGSLAMSGFFNATTKQRRGG